MNEDGLNLEKKILALLHHQKFISVFLIKSNFS